MKMIEIQPFKNSIYIIEDLELDLDKINREFDIILEKYSIPRGLGRITPNLIPTQNPVLKEIIDKIDPIAKNIIKSWGMDNPVILQNSWINVDYAGAVGDPHTHPSSVLTAVFYTNAPENSAPIRMIRPDNLSHHYRPTHPNEYSGLSYDIYVEPNTLVLFPAFMEHMMYRNNIKENEKRVCISFDWGLDYYKRQE